MAARSEITGIDERKERLRAEMKALRSAIGADGRRRIDELIARRVIESAAFRDAETVFSYLSFGAETDTRVIIQRAWQKGKTVALPRCTGPRQMRWFAVSSFDGLELSSFGVEEPALEPSNEVLPGESHEAIALVPGLAFDDWGYRLGYGGGFYDTFLEAFQGRTLGLCRDEQHVESLDALGVIGTFDVPVQTVITQSRQWETGFQEA